MISPHLSELLGFGCHYLNDEGTRVAIDTPFVFQDGDPFPVYMEQRDGKLRFFDDGGVIWHFIGVGIALDEPGDSKFIEDLAASNGLALNDEDQLEVWTDIEHAPEAFARFISTMFAAVRWEHEHDASVEERRRQHMASGADSVASLNA